MPRCCLGIVQYADNDVVILRNLILYEFVGLYVVLEYALFTGGNPYILFFVLNDVSYP